MTAPAPSRVATDAARPARPRLVLAPMAGFTDAAMRRLCHAFGAEAASTEMAHAYALAREAERLPGIGGPTWELLETLPGEGPVAAHIFGADPAALGDAAGLAAATRRFCAIDLNAGCPVPKVTHTGAGSALIRDPAKIGAIVASMRASAGALPVTLKTRLGPSPDKVAIFEILDAAVQAGASAITVHGRFTSQGHGGPVDLALLAEVKRRSPIPVTGNGGVFSADDALRMWRETGVDAIMVGRGAMGNPWIFADIRRAFDAIAADGSAAAPDAAAPSDPPGSAQQQRVPHAPHAEVRRVLESHIAGELELRRQIAARRGPRRNALSPEQCAVAAFRCHFFRYFAGLPNAGSLRGRLNSLKSLDDVRAIISDAFGNTPEETPA